MVNRLIGRSQVVDILMVRLVDEDGIAISVNLRLAFSVAFNDLQGLTVVTEHNHVDLTRLLRGLDLAELTQTLRTLENVAQSCPSRVNRVVLGVPLVQVVQAEPILGERLAVLGGHAGDHELNRRILFRGHRLLLDDAVIERREPIGITGLRRIANEGLTFNFERLLVLDNTAGTTLLVEQHRQFLNCDFHITHKLSSVFVFLSEIFLKLSNRWKKNPHNAAEATLCGLKQTCYLTGSRM